MHQSEWQRSKSLQAINAGEGVKEREPSYTVGNANQCSHYGERCGDSLKNCKQNYLMTQQSHCWAYTPSRGILIITRGSFSTYVLLRQHTEWVNRGIWQLVCDKISAFSLWHCIRCHVRSHALFKEFVYHIHFKIFSICHQISFRII